MKAWAFCSWQSDRPAVTNRRFIGRAIFAVLPSITLEPRLEFDEAAREIPGTADIPANIFRKIEESSVAIFDVTPVYRKRRGKGVVNPKVAIAPDDNPAALQSSARKIRKGQPRFRQRLLHLYDGKCAITGWTPAEVLEAARLHSHSASRVNRSRNGLLLRSDLHALLDAGLIDIDTDCRTILVSPALKNTPYWEFHKKKLRERRDGFHIELEYVLARSLAKTPSLQSAISIAAESLPDGSS